MKRSNDRTRRRPAAGPGDDGLWHAVMRDVKPLGSRPVRAVPAPAPPPVEADRSKPVVPEPPSPARPRAPRAAPAPNPGIDRRTAEKLRKGAMPVERTLDLHGLTQDLAHAALDRFVRQAWAEGIRVLLIITGKGGIGEGGGVLRRSLPRWLAVGDTAARVLRIEPAQPRHGGPGAFYVLLRRRREQRG